MEHEMLNYESAADFLGVPIGTLYAWVSQKKIPHHRYGPRLVRFSKKKLEEYLSNSEINSSEKEIGGE